MHGFDFISDSPKTFIFQKSSNKTNLGGVLTFIYLIIVILIFGSYILDYYLIENYEYSYFYKFIDDRENLKNSDINREVNFTIKLEDFDGNLMDEKEYIAFDSRDKNNSGTRININWKLDELNIYVLKKCKDERCIFTPKEILFPHYYYISYESLKIDLDNDDKPIQNQTFLRRIMFLPGNNTMKSCKGNWEIYSYKEVKGVEKIFDYLSGNKMNYTFGLIQEISCGNYFDNLNIVTKLDNTYYKYIFWFKLENPLNGINLYKRKKKSIMDYLANIASLCATIYSIMSKAFEFIYSRNFDSYKIVENLLSKGNKNKMIKKIELSDDAKSYTNDFIRKDNKNKDLNNIINNITDIDNDKLIENEETDENEENDENNDNDNTSIKLPKLRMYDFFFNNVYSPKCCVTLKKQKLLSSCENVLFKYFSIENILYNQIIFENLMKDYKWNNRKLKSIQKNDLIIEIKKYI